MADWGKRYETNPFLRRQAPGWSRDGSAEIDYKAKWEAAKAVLAERERELLELKGQCSNCRLHYAHAGPCAPEKGERANG